MKKYIKIKKKFFQIERIEDQIRLYHFGVQIAYLRYGQESLDRYYRGSIEEWVQAVYERDINILAEPDCPQHERATLRYRWRKYNEFD